MVPHKSRNKCTDYRCLQLDRLCLQQLAVPWAASVQENVDQQQQQQQPLHAQPLQQQEHAQNQDQLWLDLAAGMVSPRSSAFLPCVHCSCAVLSNSTTRALGYQQLDSCFSHALWRNFANACCICQAPFTATVASASAVSNPLVRCPTACSLCFDTLRHSVAVLSHSFVTQLLAFEFHLFFVMLWVQVTSGIYTSLTYPVHRVKILLQTQDANPRIISGALC